MVGLYNVSADPGEHVDLKLQYPDVVAALVAKLQALEGAAMEPCNLPGGTCDHNDKAGLVHAKRMNAWVPWVKDEL